MQESFFVQKDSGDSVSNLSIISGASVLFEGKNTGPTSPVTRSKGVDLQIKTDPELRAPTGYCCNLSIFLDNSRKANVLPDQVSVGCRSCCEEFVSSKDFHVFECSGIFVFYTANLLPINRNSEKDLILHIITIIVLTN